MKRRNTARGATSVPKVPHLSQRWRSRARLHPCSWCGASCTTRRGCRETARTAYAVVGGRPRTGATPVLAEHSLDGAAKAISQPVGFTPGHLGQFYASQLPETCGMLKQHSKSSRAHQMQIKHSASPDPDRGRGSGEEHAYQTHLKPPRRETGRSASGSTRYLSFGSKINSFCASSAIPVPTVG